jgi:hypothetical protein
VLPKEAFGEFEKIHKRTPFGWEDECDKWTRKILEYFCFLGVENGLEIGTNSRYWEDSEKTEYDETGFRQIKVYGKWVDLQGEYLVDFCWYRTRPKYGVPLAMEVEWRSWRDYETLDPDWDFYKLLDIKSPMKIWVSSVPESKKQQELELLHEVLKNRTEIHLPGLENYLIVFFPYSETNLWVRGYEGDHKIGLKNDMGWREVGAFEIEK